MARKGLGQANTLRTNNMTATGYGVAYADEISGHRTVKNLPDLYALYDWQLSASGDNTDSDAIGQLWYVVDADGKGNGNLYQLTDWDKRGEESGWKVFTASAGADLTDYAKKSDLALAESSISEKLAAKADKTEVESTYVKETELVSLSDEDIDALWG